jgi:hypothetical protein
MDLGTDETLGYVSDAALVKAQALERFGCGKLGPGHACNHRRA